MDIETKVGGLENRLTTLERQGNIISRYISSTDQTVINTGVASRIEDTLWGNVYYTSSFASTQTTTTATETLDVNVRDADTTGGLWFTPAKKSKFRMTFFINAGLSKSTVYIASPGISKVSTTPTAIASANNSFVGVKIVAGAVKLVACRNGSETVLATSKTIADSNTHKVEIQYNISHATVIFDNVILGTIACNLSGITFATYWSYITSFGSSDGTTVTVDTERYEFIQNIT